MFEKTKNWCDEHPKVILCGIFVATYVTGVAVGRYLMRSQLNTGLNAMCLADPTLVDHLKTASESVENTMTKVSNF